MKFRKNGIIYYAKIDRSKGGMINIDGVDYNAPEFFLEDIDIVEISRDEMEDLNKFFIDLKFMVRECWQYWKEKLKNYGLEDENELH